jgi:nucleoside-diphosphate-sugar epimerase
MGTQRPDITVYAVDYDSRAICDYGSYFLRWANINIINCDITDHEQIKKLPRADLIVHLAAKVGYISANKDPDVTANINVNGVKNIAALKTPTVFFSTGSVYGKIGQVCDENVPPNPQTIYAETKYKGEQEIKHIDHVIFRPATAYGLSLHTRHDLIVHDLIQQAVAKKTLKIYQPGAIRSFYSVQKLAELIEFTCDNFDQFKNNVYNVGCQSGNMTKQQLLDKIALFCNIDYVTVPGQDADTRDYNVCYDKLKAIWPNHDETFLDNIPVIVEYYKQWSQ